MWYVIQVRAGREDYVAESCKKYVHAKEEVFVPSIERERKVRGIGEMVVRPMFPGYIFFDTNDASDLFYRLKKVKEFTRILRTGDEFTPISSQEEMVLRKLGGDRHRVVISNGYKEGHTVVITDGPLKDFEGKIIHIDRSRRTAEIEVSLIGEMRHIRVGLRVLKEGGQEKDG